MPRRAEAQQGRGQAETYLLITRLMGWDPGRLLDRLTTTVARLARIAEKNS